jgi:hypothetical protein
MKLVIHAIVTVLLAVTGCTSDGYDGCHGTGCLVDSPDDRRRNVTAGGDQSIDDRPQFDREGNPNFDTQGNYQGCHGIGCEVDTPSDDGSTDDDDSD